MVWIRRFAVLSALASVPSLHAQAMSEQEIKTGFLFHFTRFVDWPDSAFRTPTAPFTLCIVGATPITALLEGASAGKAVGQHPMLIKTLRPADDLHACQLVFLSASEERRSPHILDSLKNANILTVGETRAFRRAGGILTFVIQENKVKLELNLNAADAAGLKVSAKLIAVARLVAPERD